MITLITGPPGAGKSTLAATMPGHHWEREDFKHDRHYRNAITKRCQEPNITATIIRCCFNPAQLTYWQRITNAHHTITLDPGLTTCLERIGDDEGRASGAIRWYQSWHPDTPTGKKTTPHRNTPGPQPIMWWPT